MNIDNVYIYGHLQFLFQQQQQYTVQKTNIKKGNDLYKYYSQQVHLAIRLHVDIINLMQISKVYKIITKQSNIYYLYYYFNAQWINQTNILNSGSEIQYQY
ncbi:hypothetical protein IMG5_148720 [Ichthyophthirius multifiliis]|uniref:Uncharacterized protein n=1 Tax=Ichthyophthirius multifiliis TaxID=5932 RepID=G0QYC7_ICHMU|nr:hypothetical protein IMG5_148720 [Ichthyophthirius multifiliis]EGR29790.1 hypothetical protein IMG5_148720 [Ichthyophthirius multifiliis]|eukprot:XP_004031026.1 hypothetical protein IMG5_148720 [Ichthyophthirius multifiliis]